TPMPDRPPLLRALIEQLGPARDGGLGIGGIPASELAQRFGTPLYVYSADVLRARYRAVQATFGDDVEILYALKANPSLAVTAVLAASGAGAEVASAGEIHLAAAAGIPGDRIHFAGPGKSGLDLQTAFDHGVYAIN